MCLTSLIRLVELGHQLEELLAALEYGLEGIGAEHFRVEWLASSSDMIYTEPIRYGPSGSGTV